MKKKYATIIIIPCFNEGLRINEQDYLDFASVHHDHLLIFINDGSTDNTEAVIKQLITQTPNFDLYTYKKNKGKAEAVRQGFLYAMENYEFNVAGFMDADLSTPLSELLHMERAFQQNASLQIVMGSRIQMLGKTITRNLFRHWFSRIIATFICKVLDEPVYDTQCGAKLFTKEAVNVLFTEKFLSKWLFDVELLARHKKSYGKENFKTTVTEFPVSQWTEKENSKLRYHHVFRILLDLSKINKHYF